MNSIEFLNNLDSYKAYTKKQKKISSITEDVLEEKDQREFSNIEKSELAERLNAAVKNHKDISSRISFSFDDQTKKFIMTLVNSDTHEVIREIPSKELRNLMMHINKTIGMIVDEER
jgi:flagellar protein FlaG